MVAGPVRLLPSLLQRLKLMWLTLSDTIGKDAQYVSKERTCTGQCAPCDMNDCGTKKLR